MKILSILMTLLFSLPAFGWQYLDSFDKDERYLVKKILKGQTTTINYCIKKYPIEIKDPHTYILDAIKHWTYRFEKDLNTKIAIIENCNAADISVTYNKKNALSYVYNYEKPVVANILYPFCSGQDDDLGRFCTVTFDIILELDLLEQKLQKGQSISMGFIIQNVLTHEFGHAFGLGDEYGGNWFREKTILARTAIESERNCSIMNAKFESSTPSDYDLMGLMILYSKYKNDDVKYKSFLEGEEGYYVNGNREGLWKITGRGQLTHILNGKSIDKGDGEGLYIKGQRQGLWKLTSEQLEEKGTYKDDVRVGVWEEYNKKNKTKRCLDYDLNLMRQVDCKVKSLGQ